MASTTVTTRSLPKRKRAAINYHESSTDESDLDDEYATSEEESAARARKVCESMLTVFGYQI